MKQQLLHQSARHRAPQHSKPILIASCLALCFILLSACSPTIGGNNSGGGNKANVIPTIPPQMIDSTTKDQGDMQLQTFQQWIDLMKKYGGDVTTYQQQYTADQQGLQNAQTKAAYNTTLNSLKGHVTAIQIPAMKEETQGLQQQLQQQVTSWGQEHTYHNAFDNTTYPLGFEYGPKGIGGWVQDDMTSAKTMADYQQAIENLQMYLTNFQMMKTNSADKTAYNQVHQTDIQLMQHYGEMDKKVIVVSLEEQAMRAYDHGKLVNSFLVTTGRPTLPTPPGDWWVEGKKSPTVFKPEPGVKQGDPRWYPDTPINYAMQYHSDGYFIHDSWWRADYGPGTNYPHADATGDPFSAQGSHGCVNMSKDNAGWVYGFVQVYTSIIIY